MTDWKKLFRWFLTVLLLVLLGLEVYMELRYPCDEIFVTSTNTEKILRRTPEVVITEEDKALMEELLAVPSVQRLLESGENGEIYVAEDPNAVGIVKKYLSGESAESLNISALFYEDGHAVSLGWRDGKEIFCLQQTPERDGAEYYKLYAPKRGNSYENWDNERARKSEVHRRWFAWLRDGMWKDGE